MRIASALAVLVGIILSASGCSRAVDPVASVLWRQVDAAESRVYGILSSPTSHLSSTDALLEALSATVEQWDGDGEVTIPFPADAGTAVFYNFTENAETEVASFDLFAASGVDEHFSVPGWLDSRPSRVYTCYRIEVAFEDGGLDHFRRSHAEGDDRLECPSELVDALGDGTQYREPSVFDG